MSEVAEKVEENEKEVQLTPEQIREQDAKHQGWVPLDEWVANGNNPGEHRSPSEFLMVGENIRERRLQNKKIEALEESKRTADLALNKLVEQNKKMEEMGYKRALRELKVEHRSAVAEDDDKLAQDIEDQMEELRDNRPQYKKPVESVIPDDPKVLDDNLERYSAEWRDNPVNNWYKKDQALADSYHGIIQRLHRTNPDLIKDPEALLNKASTELRSAFPEKFRTTPANPVHKNTPNAGGGGDKPVVDYSDPDVQELAIIGKRLKQAGGIDSVEDYIKSVLEDKDKVPQVYTIDTVKDAKRNKADAVKAN